MNEAVGFRRVARATIVAVYFLILVGGLVRASGAGMGCPDWPRCFDRWVPPTREGQLPADYQTLYAERGYAETRFNPVKTWTEYVNRLIGVSIGLLVFATLIGSLRFWRARRSVTWWSLAAFLLVGFEGWLGSVVVQSNLEPWVITLHMVAALLVVGALLVALDQASKDEPRGEPALEDAWLGRLLIAALALTLAQIALGTQVREEVDRLMIEAAGAREGWMRAVGVPALVHRSFSLLVIATNALLAWRLRRAAGAASRPARLGVALVAVLAVEAGIGAALFYLGVPAALQPAHLLLAAVAGGLQLLLAILVVRGRRAAAGAAGAASAAV